MKSRIQYLLGAAATIPFLPLMYFQGQQVRKGVPKLPEAINPAGKVAHPLPRVEKAFRLITIGESTIAGVGVDTHENGITGAMARQLSAQLSLSVDWRVYARSGYTVKRVTEEIVPVISESEADMIVIGLGGNDAFELNTPWGWRRDVEQLLAAVEKKFPDTLIVFCNMPPIKEFPAFTSLMKATIGNLVEAFGRELKELTQAYSTVYYYAYIIKLEDWRHYLDDPTSGMEVFYSDGVHPSPLTYHIWGTELMKVVCEEEKCLPYLASSLQAK